MSETFEDLRRELVSGCRDAVVELCKNHSDESFYAFALYMADDATAISFSASSHESVEKEISSWLETNWYANRDQMIAHAQSDNPDELRWSVSNWRYDGVGYSHFKAANAIEESIRAAREFEWEQRYSQVLAAMTLALGDLMKQGFFDPAVVAYCSVVDSSNVAWVERESARFINSPENFEVFDAAWNRRWTSPSSLIADERDTQVAADDDNAIFCEFIETLNAAREH